MSARRLVYPVLLLAVSLLFIGSCGQTQMVAASGKIREHMINRNYDAALATLRQSKNEGFKEQDRVVYWMNEGMILYLMGRYKESADILEKAEQRSKELYTKKISKEIKAAFTSDAARDYPGEDYENVLVNVVKVMGYLGLSDQQGALVEARKINEKLELYNTRYEKKNVYNQDAFAHWLMGLLFELERSYDDARIAYVKALEAYKQDFAGHYGIEVPPYLAEDVVRSCILSNAKEEEEKYRGELGQDLGKSAEELKTKGEVVLFHLNGEGPSKSDYFVTCFFRDPRDPRIPIPTEWHCDGEPGEEFVKKITIDIPQDATVIKVAFPQLHLHPPANPHLELEVAGQRTRSFIAEPISAIAQKYLADKMHRIWRDAIIRVVTKTVTSKAAGGAGAAAGGKGLAWLAEKGTSAAMQATEEADKRAWTTLPARIEVARLLVPPGPHDLVIHLPRGGTQRIPQVKVEAGKRVFVTFRTLP